MIRVVYFTCRQLLLAGHEPAARHTILKDFLLVAQKLEQLGFTYYDGKITIIDWLGEQ